MTDFPVMAGKDFPGYIPLLGPHFLFLTSAPEDEFVGLFLRPADAAFEEYKALAEGPSTPQQLAQARAFFDAFHASLNILIRRVIAERMAPFLGREIGSTSEGARAFVALVLESARDFERAFEADATMLLRKQGSDLRTVAVTMKPSETYSGLRRMARDVLDDASARQLAKTFAQALPEIRRQLRQ
jgi:hypothetical protein